MIKKIHLQNFFSFQDEEINLDPNQNILIGINGSGKTNLLKGLKILQSAVSGDGIKKLIYDQWGGFDAIRFHDRGGNAPIKLTFQFDHEIIRNYGFGFNEDIFYSITINKTPHTSNYNLSEKVYLPRTGQQNDWIYLEFDKGNGVIFEKEEKSEKPKLIRYVDLDPQESALGKIYDPDRYYALSTIKKALSEIIVYDYFDTTPTSKIRKPVLPTSESRLFSDGSNLPQVLNTIKINDKVNFKKIKELLSNVNEKYEGFDFNLVGGNIELMLEENGLNQSIHVTHVSDGTLRFLCLLAIFFNRHRGNLVCIDEPEVGLHPDMIRTVCESIKETSDSTQYLIATHSEHILDAFEIQNVRVFEKDKNNATGVKEFADKDFEEWYDSFGLGRMWRQGDFGGNRW